MSEFYTHPTGYTEKGHGEGRHEYQPEVNAHEVKDANLYSERGVGGLGHDDYAQDFDTSRGQGVFLARQAVQHSVNGQL